MKKTFVLLAILILIGTAAYLWRDRILTFIQPPPTPTPVPPPPPAPSPLPIPSPTPLPTLPLKEKAKRDSAMKASSKKSKKRTTKKTVNKKNIALLKKQMLAQLKKEPAASKRTLKIPAPLPADEPLIAPPTTPLQIARAQGRKKREGLPMGVILWDGTNAYGADKGSKKLYGMQTGDFVRVLDEKDGRVQVHPGLDIYLAATTKRVEPAGERLPDQSAWVDKSKIQIFTPDQAKEFIWDLTPVTLGQDPSFSTLAFYERAMKNPDPVVHRVIGPRLISVVTLHADYATSWFSLYRDRDSKIRAATLASLRERGIANSRPVIEDLIQRVAELTTVRAQGETEVEALAVLDILRTTHHPRVPTALASFIDTWKQTQNQPLNESLREIMSGSY